MIKLFSAQQIKEWDNHTIVNEPISSLDLMERASLSFANWFEKHKDKNTEVSIFCGPGNNGGDGLAISRLLSKKGYKVFTYLINTNLKFSNDCKTNYERIKKDIKAINNLEDIDQLTISKNSIIIDALFGSGLSRPLEGIYKKLVEKLNSLNNFKIAVDIPSGMYCDQFNQQKDVIFKTKEIVSFQIPKRAFFFKENRRHFSSYTVLDIGLSSEYYENTESEWGLVNNRELYQLQKENHLEQLQDDLNIFTFKNKVYVLVDSLPNKN